MKFKRSMPTAAFILSLLSFLSLPAFAESGGWKHSLGTGIFGLNVDGEMGINSPALGDIKAEVDVNFSDVRDVLEEAYGFNGVSQRGSWVIIYSYAHLKMSGKEDLEPRFLPKIRGEASFEADVINLAVNYWFGEYNRHRFGALAGVRYVNQDIKFKLNDSSSERGDNWADLVLGMTHAMKLNERWTWSNRFDVGFIESEGTYHFNTAFTRKLSERWNLVLFGDIIQHDYNSGSKGQSTYYVYDAAEYGLGANIYYNF